MKALTLTAVGVVLAGATVQAQDMIDPQLYKGTHELTVSGSADFEKRDDYWYYADVGYGYFIMDGLELGVTFSFQGSDQNDRLTLGPFVEYNFLTKSQFVPFLSLGAQWVNADIEVFSDDRLVDTSTDALLLDAEAGVKIFLRDNIALATALAYEWATDDVFGAQDDVDSGNGLLKVGMRFYL